MFIVKHFKDLSVDEFFEITKARYEVFACEQKLPRKMILMILIKNVIISFL